MHSKSSTLHAIDAYRERYGHYPERVIADPIYGTRANRDYLKQRNIHFAGKTICNAFPSRANLARAKRATGSTTSAQARQHLVRLDQHHLPGHEPADPGKDLFWTQ